jgi:hypothetical protein
MAVTRLTTNGLTGTKYDIASADNYYMEPIATTLVGSGGVSSVTFSNIPNTYKHLQIRGILKNTNGGAYDDPSYMRFNSDTGSNYSYHSVYGNGSGASAFSGVSQTSIIAYGTPANNFTNVWGAAIIDILNYANTNKFKTTRWLNGFDSNTTTGSINFNSGSWLNTSTINSITFTPVAGVWPQYSRFSLYGIKA